MRPTIVREPPVPAPPLSSVVTVSADGRTSRQHDVLRYAYDTDGVRQQFRVTFVVRGTRS